MDAVLAQDYPADAYEIILVDNGSSDRSAEIISAYEKKCPRVRALQELTPGAYAARNSGVRKASGQVIAFTDPDCIPAQNWLRAIDQAFRVPGREIVLGTRFFDKPSRQLRRLSEYDTVLAEHVFSSNAADLYFGYTNNMAVRRSLFEKVGAFHEISRGADSVFVRQTVDRLGTDSVGFDPSVSVCHLEILSVADFYRKRLAYGMSNSRTRRLGTARPLSHPSRLKVFMATARANDYSVLEAAELVALLAVGLGFYEFGRWRGR